LSTSTDAAVDPIAMTTNQIFFNLWISTSFGSNAGICAIVTIGAFWNISYEVHDLSIFSKKMIFFHSKFMFFILNTLKNVIFLLFFYLDSMININD